MLKYFQNFVLGILYFPLIYRALKNNLKILFYVPNNHFSYNQLSFVFFFRKILVTILGLSSPFFLLLLQKDFDIFHVLLFQAFLCYFVNIYHFYVYKKIYKKTFISYISIFLTFFSRILFIKIFHQNFFYQNFLLQNFFHQNFLYQNQNKFLHHQ